MKAAAIIVAGGGGSRFGGAPKQYRDLLGRPVIRWSVDLLAGVPEIASIVVVAREDAAEALATALEGADGVRVAPAGDSRTASVRSGLDALAGDPPDIVLIHDAARPLASPALVRRLLDALAEADAAAPALPPVDAMKRDEDGALGDDIPRAGLIGVQTPQAFRYAPLLEAYRGLPADADLPDDIAVARGAGMRAASVPGERTNIKITYAEDLEMMARLAGRPPAPRIAVGHGFDVHRLAPGDGVTLCGVAIPCKLSLVGHSDADAGLHALCDAMLGAAGAGDIGQHFPPSDPQWKDADSARFVERCVEILAGRGGRVVHADVTLICEAPKIGPHRDAMAARLCELLNLPAGRANVKATTTERLGYAGRGEGLAAQATATVEFVE